jgi:hypothetical protein
MSFLPPQSLNITKFETSSPSTIEVSSLFPTNPVTVGQLPPTKIDILTPLPINGKNASLLELSIEMEEAVASIGTPIAINRATGKGILARTAPYTSSFVIGLAKTLCPTGHRVFLEIHALSLADWTSLTGAIDLLEGIPYFLSEGSLTTIPNLVTESLVLIGEAISPKTLRLTIETPTKL